MQPSKKYTPREAAQALFDSIDVICDLNKTNTEIINNNIVLNQKLNGSLKALNRMTQAAIYYDAVYSRLPQDQREAFDRIGLKVIDELGLDVLK